MPSNHGPFDPGFRVERFGSDDVAISVLRPLAVDRGGNWRLTHEGALTLMAQLISAMRKNKDDG